MLVINLLFGVCISLNQDVRIVCLGQIGQLIMSNSNWEVLKTIPKVQNFQESLRFMDGSQVDLNIAEISLLTLTSKEVLKWYGLSMTKIQFYLKVAMQISQYRYVLESLLKGKISETLKSTINFACSKFDQQFVNGEDHEGSFKSSVMSKPFKKQSRLNFIIGREEISTRLDQLSQKIFQIQGQELKRQYFQSKIADINNYLLKLELQVVMPLVKDKQSSQEADNFQQMKGMYICRGQNMQKVKEISLINSYYIKTKNRHPLVLDFTFARYIYKNDQQLSHEILAIQLSKYVNAILGKEYIIAYEILPEKHGAFYEFVENSKTISELKGQQQNSSLLPYFQKLCEKHTPDNILGKFAQTYSGFCLIQYLLDIKDRNNANIMIRQDGAIFHIDLAFILSSGPGGLNFQSAPFKMTKEYVKILGGFQSDYFRKFEALLVQHFTKVVQCKDELMWKLKTLAQRNKEIRCFSDFSASSFSKKIPSKLQKVKSFVEDLIDKSYDSWKTNKYDDYQLSKNGILK